MWAFNVTALFISLIFATSTQADTMSATNGGDSFIAGNTIAQTYDAAGDVFAAGEVVTTSGTAGGDVHVAGFDVDVDTSTGTDLYAMGATVGVHADVGEDVSAMGYSVRLSSDAAVGRNGRFLGRSIIIDGPVTGALSIAGGEVTLNGAVGGDVHIVAEELNFGPNAQIDGLLTYSTDEPITVPERVMSEDRVTFQDRENGQMWREMDDIWENYEISLVPAFVSLLSVFIVTLAFFMVIGSIFLTFTPKPIASMRREIAGRPGHIFLLGILGLSMLFGLVPITALTVIGLPFVPFAVLMIIVAWTLGYVLAAYAIAMRLLALSGGPTDPVLLTRMLVLAAAICVVTLLNFIPFVGWIVNYTLVLLGIGAMTSALFNRLLGNPGYAMDVDMKPVEE